MIADNINTKFDNTKFWQYQICFWTLGWWIGNFTTLPLEKRYFVFEEILYLACPMFAESKRTVLNSWTFWLLFCYVCAHPWNWWYSNKLCIVEFSHNSSAFLDSVEAQFLLFLSACLQKYYFFRLPSRHLFESF